jgi:OOP family OmpA-OmpF porin
MATLVQTGKDLLDRALGGRLGPLVEAAAGATGVKHSAMASLLGLAAPLVFRVLGREVQTRQLDAVGLGSLLQEQRSAVARYLPPGFGDLPRATEVARTAPVSAPRPRETASRSTWWPLLLLIPAFLVGAFLLQRRPEPATPRTTPERSFGIGIPEQPPAPRQPVEVALPTGPAELHVGSVGQQMAQWLGSNDGEASKRFVFDDLSFDTATAGLMPASATTLDDVATVLKAYPSARVALEGHTDASGPAAANQQLSEDRASAVKAALVTRGVPADHLTTAGFGQDRPIASNDTDEGRAKNCRTEIVVTRR